MVFAINSTINISKTNIIYTPVTYTVVYTSLITPANQFINIPSNIIGTVNIKCWGAGGGTLGKGNLQTLRKTGRGGGGGYTEGNFINMAGQTLTIIVGENGKTYNTGTSAPATFGGGGGQNLGGDANWGSASGGGRSAVRLSDGTEIITAGGGGGGGGTLLTNASIGVCDGGAGGGLIAGDGEKSNPISGTSATPTTLDYNGKGGKSNIGGNAVTCDVASSSAGTQFNGGFGSTFAPGGGGGWYGGSGGGSTRAPTNQWIFAGGGGGSSNINTTLGTLVQITQASGSTVAAANKLPAGYSSLNIGNGGVPSATTGADNGTNGLPGLVVITYTA